MHVQFEAVGTGGDAQIEGGQRVLGTERASTAMRKHLGTAGRIEGHDVQS